MAVKDQILTDNYALYHGDCVDVMGDMPDDCVDLSIYSPPFSGLYNYSSSPRDLSNCRDYDEFLDHYGFVIEQLARVTKPGRCSAVHCNDVQNFGLDGGKGLRDLPGDIIRLHAKHGMHYVARFHVWKEPLGVRLRTMALGLAHQTIVNDSTKCDNASADYLLIFRNGGENQVPVSHPEGLTHYAGERQVPQELMPYRGWTGKQTENRYSHWIWRNYASAFWDDIRGGRVLPYKDSREQDDEKHVHPLQLDVIERACVLWSNPGETVLTPFMGVGSEVYGSVINGRRGVGVELKASYYRQAVHNLELCHRPEEQESMFSDSEMGPIIAEEAP